MKIVFTAGMERYMMHCNDIEKCMAIQSGKGMKKGLNLIGDFSTNSRDYKKQYIGILFLKEGKKDLAESHFLINCNSFCDLILYIKKIPAVNFNENDIYSREGEIYDALQ